MAEPSLPQNTHSMHEKGQISQEFEDGATHENNGDGPSSDAQVEQVGEERLGTLYWASLNLEQIQELTPATPLADYLELCESVSKLELFMHSLSNSKHLLDYPNLRELSLHLQTLPPGASIGGKARLHSLSITECGLRSMDVISNVPSLTQLNLSHNHISLIDGTVLEATPKLQTLWLNDNHIRCIEGLETLSQLKVLWLGRNLVTSVGEVFEKNNSLQELVLAGNQIGSFKDISSLVRVKSLSSLALSESSPVGILVTLGVVSSQQQRTNP